MKKWAVLLVASFLITTGTFSEAVAEFVSHVSQVDIWLDAIYDDPGNPASTPNYDFEIEVNTDQTVDSVVVTCPGDANPVTLNRYDMEAGEQEWGIEENLATIETFAASYGDGDYRITLNFNDGSPSFQFTVPFRKTDGSNIPLVETMPQLVESAANPEPLPSQMNVDPGPALGQPYIFHWVQGVAQTSFANGIAVELEKDGASDDFEMFFPLDSGDPGQASFTDVLDNGSWSVWLWYAHVIEGNTTEGIPFTVGKGAGSKYRYLVGPHFSISGRAETSADIPGCLMVNFHDASKMTVDGSGNVTDWGDSFVLSVTGQPDNQNGMDYTATLPGNTSYYITLAIDDNCNGEYDDGENQTGGDVYKDASGKFIPVMLDGDVQGIDIGATSPTGPTFILSGRAEKSPAIAGCLMVNFHDAAKVSVDPFGAIMNWNDSLVDSAWGQADAANGFDFSATLPADRSYYVTMVIDDNCDQNFDTGEGQVGGAIYTDDSGTPIQVFLDQDRHGIYLTGNSGLPADPPCAGDPDGDGKLSLGDAIYILQTLSGMGGSN